MQTANLGPVQLLRNSIWNATQRVCVSSNTKIKFRYWKSCLDRIWSQLTTIKLSHRKNGEIFQQFWLSGQIS